MAIRVLHIVTYMGRGGLETMLMNYYRHIDKNKVQFDFLVHRDFEADYDVEILKMGGKIFRVSRLVPWSNSYKKELRKFFREHPEYKIVHVHQDCLSSVALKVAKECGIPVRIAHCHSSSADKNIKYPIKMYYKKKIPLYATELFTCGKSAGDWMFGGHEYQIIRNAIDTRQYRYNPVTGGRVRKEFDLENELVIGHVGRFNPPKNHRFLIDVFSKIVKKVPNAKLLLVGDGDGRTEIQEKVVTMGIQDNVIFTGIRTDVNELMQAMDVFVFPSLYEGLPVTMVEAQAAGLPCIVSDHVPQECVITNGLVTIQKLEDTPENWAEHILSETEKQWQSRGREAYYNEIKDSGYDITEAAKWLECYYTTHSGE
ncbi:MAG: glycosyltransferase family 1 protein [Lachnospiraceae bacterium]|nr:glycosyltransferase family 1 protein [Lachnospiraceae bacterium]